MSRLRAIEVSLVGADLDERVLRLRTAKLRPEREARDAALFTYGRSQRTGIAMGFAREEASDYDFVVTWAEKDVQHYAPVQLKELVPADLNASASLSGLLDGIASNAPASGTVLAIKLNRRTQIDLSNLTLPRMPYTEAWFFWAASEDQARWALFGDAMGNPSQSFFEYPELDGAAA